MIGRAVVSLATVLGLWLGGIGEGEAAAIQLSLSPRAELVERFLSLAVTVHNGGDESAFQMRATVEAGDRIMFLQGPDRLSPGEQHVLEAHGVPVSWLRPGSYPVVFRLRYQDGNGHPFSTLAVVPVSRWEVPLSPVHLTVESDPITPSGLLRVGVANRSRRAQELRLEVLAPSEFTVSPSLTTLRLAPRETRDYQFTLHSDSALPGSAYPVFVVVEGDWQGRHLTTAERATIPVLASSTSRDAGLLIMVMVGILPLLLLTVYRLRPRLAAWLRSHLHRRPLPSRSPV